MGLTDMLIANWPSVLIAVLALVSLLAVFRTKGKTVAGIPKGLSYIVLLAIAGLVIWQAGFFTGVAPGVIPPVSIVQTTTQATSGTSSTSVCPAGVIVDKTTITLSAQDEYTSISTGGTHRYRINGNPALTVADAGTFTASPGDIVEVLFFNESKSGASNYFGVSKKVPVECKGSQTISAKLSTNGTVAPTINIFNEEGNIVEGSGGSSAENETLGAGDVVSLKVEFKPTFQTGFPSGAVLIFEYGQAVYDDVKVSIGGVDLTKTGVPTSYTRRYVNNNTVAYEFPPTKSLETVTATITIDVDDTNNPTAAGGAENIPITFIPKNVFVNDDLGGSYSGPSVEDEDSVPTFRHATRTNITVD